MFSRININLDGNYYNVSFRNKYFTSGRKVRLIRVVDGVDEYVTSTSDYASKTITTNNFTRGKESVFKLELTESDDTSIETSSPFKVYIPKLPISSIGVPQSGSFDEVYFGMPTIELVECKSDDDYRIDYFFDESIYRYSDANRLKYSKSQPWDKLNKKLTIYIRSSSGSVISKREYNAKCINFSGELKPGPLCFLKYVTDNQESFDGILNTVNKYGKLFIRLIEEYEEYISTERSTTNELLRFSEFLDVSKLTQEEVANVNSIVNYSKNIEKPFLMKEFEDIKTLKKLSDDIKSFYEFCSGLETEFKYSERRIENLIKSCIGRRNVIGYKQSNAEKYKTTSISFTKFVPGDLTTPERVFVIVVDSTGMSLGEIKKVLKIKPDKYYEGLIFLFFDDIINKYEVTYTRIPEKYKDSLLELREHILI